MNTKNFNFIDKIVAKYRLSKVLGSVDRSDRILDFGCGARSYLLELTKEKIKNGVGVDYDVEAKKEGNIEYLRQRVKGKLSFKDKSFDKVFMLAVLEHIEPKEVKNMFFELKRVLVKGGKIVLTTPTPKGKWLLEFLAFRIKIISKEEIADHKKYYDKADIERLSRDVELKLTSYELFFASLNSCAILEKV